MHDMPATRPVPPNDHALHDPLLIAQLAAGDPLEAAQHREAERLVSSCPACALLTADLGAIAAAVANEPMPRRRRDFRFDAERAAQLRGSPVTRLLRRLSLPQAGALRPVAAGILSLGLLFVVAGTVWPDTGTVQAPLVESASPAAAIQPEATGGSVSDPSPLAALAARAPSATGDTATGNTATGDTTADAVDREAFAAADTQAGDVQGMDARGEDVSGADTLAAAMPVATDADLLAEQSRSVPMDARAKALAAQPAASAAAGAAPMAAAPLETVSEQAPPAALAAEASAENGQVAEEPATESAVVDGSGLPVETVLLTLGAILALAGALLLGLAWLARRTTDPLLR